MYVVGEGGRASGRRQVGDGVPFPTVEQKDTAGPWLRPVTQYCTMFKTGRSWAIYVWGTWVGLLGAQQVPQTKLGKSIPGHIGELLESHVWRYGTHTSPFLNV
jgi:hypothetical protein